MSLAELTVDLLFKICDGLDEESARSFAASSAWHGAVLTGWSQWRAKLSQSVEGTIGRPRLLRPNERNNERVVLVSYPRSGNSLLRMLLERVTGVVTGSDTRPDRVLSRSLLRQGLKGEGLVDERSWVVKTHWPERYGCARFPAHRVILLLRNPFDAIDSYFNMGMTNTHEKSLREDLYESLHDIWDEMVRVEVKVWAKFNAYWLKKSLPVIAIRYEDLVLHPEEVLTRVVAFLEKMPCEAVRASHYGERIKEVARGVSKQRQTPYKPRSGKVGASLRHYTQDQIDYFCREEGKALRAFGYDPVTQGFPKEILTLPPMERCVKNLDVVGAMVTVNRGRMVRELDDKYGRNITKVRHALTDSDRQPLPTVSKGGGGGGGGGSGDDQAQGQQDGAAEQQQQLVAEAAAGQLVVEEDKEEMPAAAAVVPGEKGAGGGAGEWSPRGEAVASEQTV